MRIGSWQIDEPILARVVPFALYLLFLVIEDLVSAVAPAADTRWLYPLKIAAVIAALWYYRAHYVELKRARPRWSGLLAALVVGIVVFVLWINLDSGWLKLGSGEGGYDPRGPDGALIWSLVVIRLIGAALVVPLMEELFWRSFLMRWIQHQRFLEVDPRHVGLSAILVSSVLFGLEHSLWFAGIVAGLAYAGLYRASGNLWTAIVAHAVTNLVLGLWVLHSASWGYW